jgi:methionine sulfoxide reductase heme-binding subunit
MTALAAAGPSTDWYLVRGTGVVSLLLLTLSVMLGILGSVRFAAQRWPRFAIDTVHRDVSLLVLVVLALHIVMSVLDSFTSIKLTDAVIPFISSYRPLWMGLGALAFDLLLALAITSLVRRRLGYRSWRAIHWLAYLSWPVAVLHGLGTGSDSQAGWMLAITAACIVAVVVAVWVRIARSAEGGLRTGTAVLSAVAPIGIVIFTVAGPLAPHWSRRAGTPSTLLSKPAATVAPAASDPRLRAFSAELSGSLKQSDVDGGEIIDMSMQLSGGETGELRVRLAGAPEGGGVSLTGSQVDLLARGLPSVLAGRVTSLNGTRLQARVTDSAGSALDLLAQLRVDNQSGQVTGTLAATRPRGGA